MEQYAAGDFKEHPADQLAINTVRFLSIDAIETAHSGHPGLPLDAAPMAYVLWTRFLRHNPGNPAWFDRDRFVLSAGHGSMLLYSLLHLTGYPLTLDDIKQFRSFGSKTPGHPEREMTEGVEVTTGPLGQGLGAAVGMAIAETHLAARYNRPGFNLINHYCYVLVSDGDLMEGVGAEAASLAGHLGLGKLICLYDDNAITLSAGTQICFTEDCAARFRALGWHTESVSDGNDLLAIHRAIALSQAETERPSLIVVRTHIGYGSPHKQDTFAAHGSPLGQEETKLTKQNLGWPLEPTFLIPPKVLAHFREALVTGRQREEQWELLCESYSKHYPELAAELHQLMKGTLPADFGEAIASFPPDETGMATRVASGKVLSAIFAKLPGLIGGSADLNPSTHTVMPGAGDFEQPRTAIGDLQGSSSGGWNLAGRNIHFGVREHAMGAILNGLAVHGGLIPYGATFLTFSDYMRPAIRLAALMQIGTIYIFTHDSLALGEDGPTHQSVEHLASLRAIPHLTVIRPADANETAEAWRLAITSRHNPVALILTRQDVPTLDRSRFTDAKELSRGAYILADSLPEKMPQLILIATGSEVSLIVKAGERLEQQGIPIRLVSMPSHELFAAQPPEYRAHILPPNITARLAVEAGIAQGWHHIIGDRGDMISVEGFGMSAPGPYVMRAYGFTADNVYDRAIALWQKEHSNRELQTGGGRRIGLAADHGGFALKRVLSERLSDAGYEIVDFGNSQLQSDDDYPDFVIALARALALGKVERGIALCSSGVGACVVANKVTGVRACLIHDLYSAHQGVEHDNVNLICIGEGIIGQTVAFEVVKTFLHARFDDRENHRRRLQKIGAIERESWQKPTT